MITKDWFLLGGTRKERYWLCLCCGDVLKERRGRWDIEPYEAMRAGLLSVGLHHAPTKEPR